MTDPLSELTLDAMQKVHRRLEPYVRRTPSWRWEGRELPALLGKGTEVHVKMELLQNSGTFKARGALSNMLDLSDQQRAAGVTAMSAGNHAIAVAFASKALGMSAKVVMQASANPLRIAAARSYGAEVLTAADGPTGFAMAEAIAREEGRTFIHPFDGYRTALGTAGVGLEMMADNPDLQAVIIAIGGGGLAGGAAAAIKQINPACKVYGVEPEGADSMSRSFAAGQPQTIVPKTIADSLAPPMSLAFGLNLCRKVVDEMVLVSDEAMRRAMGLIFRDLKFAVEPACAAATAALLGPLREKLAGQRVGVVLCGSNIDEASFCRLVQVD